MKMSAFVSRKLRRVPKSGETRGTPGTHEEGECIAEFVKVVGKGQLLTTLCLCFGKVAVDLREHLVLDLWPERQRDAREHDSVGRGVVALMKPKPSANAPYFFRNRQTYRP